MSKQKPSLPRPSLPCPCAHLVEGATYDLMLAALPMLRDLEHRGLTALAARVDTGGVTVQIACPPAGVIPSWCYVSPPARMPAAPVTCRSIWGTAAGDLPLAVEWEAVPARQLVAA